MAQEFVVLQCCQCHTYQVQQSKKATKWLCKICNQKQSFKQFFGRGSAKECRFTVQSLNSKQFGEQNGIEGVLIDCNQTNDSNITDIDTKILDMILAKEDDSSDEMSAPKRQKLSHREVDENVESNQSQSESKKSFANNNQTVNRRVSKWSQFMSK